MWDLSHRGKECSLPILRVTKEAPVDFKGLWIRPENMNLVARLDTALQCTPKQTYI